MNEIPNAYEPVMQMIFWCQVVLLPFLLFGTGYNIKHSFGKSGFEYLIPGTILLYASAFNIACMIINFKYAW